MTQLRLDGRTAFVTGGASGIGAATVRRLADEGARSSSPTSTPRGDRVAKEIDGFAVQLDVVDVRSVRAAFDLAEDAVGPVDILVNNAGADRFDYFVDTDEAAWDLVLAVNLQGVLACTHAVLRSCTSGGRCDRERVERGGPGRRGRRARPTPQPRPA